VALHSLTLDDQNVGSVLAVLFVDSELVTELDGVQALPDNTLCPAPRVRFPGPELFVGSGKVGEFRLVPPFPDDTEILQCLEVAIDKVLERDVEVTVHTLRRLHRVVTERAFDGIPQDCEDLGPRRHAQDASRYSVGPEQVPRRIVDGHQRPVLDESAVASTLRKHLLEDRSVRKAGSPSRYALSGRDLAVEHEVVEVQLLDAYLLVAVATTAPYSALASS